MNHQGEYIKSIQRNRGISQEDLAKSLGMTRVTLGQRLKHEIYPDTDEKIKILEILEFTDKEKEQLDEIAGIAPYTPNPASKINEPIEISPGRWLMTVELVPVYAQAGYLTGYQDREFLEELPRHSFTTNVLAKGKYRAFEISGESMYCKDVKESIPDRSVVVGRMVDRQYWTSKLHVHKWPNWIFVHKTDGIVVKQIANQDLQNGDVTLHSINPDKDKYPDYVVNLDNIVEIYNVIKRDIDEQQ